MRIVIVSTHDIVGGAAKAAYRLHLALLQSGLNSVMIVQFKHSDDPTVIPIDKSNSQFFSRLRRYIEKLPAAWLGNNTDYLCSLGWLNNKRTVSLINKFKPDIVHLHWINSGLLSVADISNLQAPVVWTLHDMWAFTSGLHVDPAFDVKRHPLPPSKFTRFQQMYMNWKKKRYSKVRNLSIVGLSKWISMCSKRSLLLSDFRHHTLPNPIDTRFYSPVDTKQARRLLGLNPEAKIILFGAWNAENDLNKGFNLLKNALRTIPSSHTVVLFGTTSEDFSKDFRQNVVSLGHITSEEVLVNLYSAADVMIVPSLYENLSNSIMESMTCGTPVVAFDVGGNSDLVQHKVNGYLAKPYSSADLADGINWILNYSEYQKLSLNAREQCVKLYDNVIVARKYVEIYKSSIERE